MAAKKTKRVVKKALKSKTAKAGGFTIKIGTKLAGALAEKSGKGMRGAKTFALKAIETAAG